jgi:cytidylate kinase
MKNYIITVARGFGTGGKHIASQLANDLGIQCYESRILTLASEFSGYDEKIFREVDEKIRGNSFANKLRNMQHKLIPTPMMNNFVSDDSLFEYQAEIIRNLAKTQSCVIVGKCADYILREYENVISVYLEAPRAFCVTRVIQSLNVSEADAHQIISMTDKYRADYYKYYTGGSSWTNPVNYDMTLNSERVGIDNCITVIKDYLKLKLGVQIQGKP